MTVDTNRLVGGVKKRVASSQDAKARKLASESRAVGAVEPVVQADSAGAQQKATPTATRRTRPKQASTVRKARDRPPRTKIRIKKTARRTFSFQQIDDQRLAQAIDKAADAGARPTPTNTDILRMGLLALEGLSGDKLLSLYRRIQRPEPEYEEY